MGVHISQFDGQWRLKIDETWEFKNFADLETVLKQLLAYKKMYGQLQVVLAGKKLVGKNGGKDMFEDTS